MRKYTRKAFQSSRPVILPAHSALQQSANHFNNIPWASKSKKSKAEEEAKKKKCGHSWPGDCDKRQDVLLIEDT